MIIKTCFYQNDRSMTKTAVRFMTKMTVSSSPNWPLNDENDRYFQSKWPSFIDNINFVPKWPYLIKNFNRSFCNFQFQVRIRVHFRPVILILDHGHFGQDWQPFNFAYPSVRILMNNKIWVIFSSHFAFWVSHLIVAVILNGFDLVFVEIIIFYYRICVNSVGYQESNIRLLYRKNN